MKNNKNKTAVKEARKALKKQLNDKLFVQIKALISEFEPDMKKVTRVIEKASKNLAKTLAAKINNDSAATAVKTVKDKKQTTVTTDKVIVAPAAKPAAAVQKPAATTVPAKTAKPAAKKPAVKANEVTAK